MIEFLFLDFNTLYADENTILKSISSSQVFKQTSFVLFEIKDKGKAVPLQAWSYSDVSRKLRLTDFMTMAQDGDKVVSLTHRPPSPPGNTPGTHFC